MSSSFPPIRFRFLVPPLLALLLGAGPARADEAADIARLARNGQGEEALRRIDALLAKQPADAQMRFMKGVMLSETRPAEAIAIFSKLTQDYPKLPEPYNNLAVLYAASGQYDKAKAALDKALRTHPAYATAFDNLGDVHARLASQAYDKALQVQPGKPAPAQLALVRNLTLPGAQSASLAVAPVAPTPVAAAATPAAAAQPPASPAPAAVALAPGKPAPPAVTIVAAAPVEARAAAPVARPESRPAPAPAPREAVPQPPQPARADAARRAEPPVRMVKADKTDKADKTEKPDPKARAAQEAAAEREAVLSAVQSWARAWSARDVQAYLAHYAPDFDPAGGMTRKAWVEERQQRIAGKGRIKVDIDKPQVTTEGNTAVVHFRQSYVSDRLSATSRKTLELERQRGKWLIKQERTAG
ncbi:tetratricopeptide repeat protein [Noviherbaspirillum sp. 1P10PC]|uniref:L,D-transpeptidase Cds6 family protein n=1 Tax=Noviherbaspirillum sp. 1P10PC TaxID=3132292 RepID=UPI0039A0ACC0